MSPSLVRSVAVLFGHVTHRASRPSVGRAPQELGDGILVGRRVGVPRGGVLGVGHLEVRIGQPSSRGDGGERAARAPRAPRVARRVDRPAWVAGPRAGGAQVEPVEVDADPAPGHPSGDLGERGREVADAGLLAQRGPPVHERGVPHARRHPGRQRRPVDSSAPMMAAPIDQPTSTNRRAPPRPRAPRRPRRRATRCRRGGSGRRGWRAPPGRCGRRRRARTGPARAARAAPAATRAADRPGRGRARPRCRRQRRARATPGTSPAASRWRPR